MNYILVIRPIEHMRWYLVNMMSVRLSSETFSSMIGWHKLYSGKSTHQSYVILSLMRMSQMTTELTSYSLSTTAYVQLVWLPEYSSFPPTFWCSQNLYVNQGVFKFHISKVEKGQRGEVFMTVINLPPGQHYDSPSMLGSILRLTCMLQTNIKITVGCPGCGPSLWSPSGGRPG